ncbi:LPS translocon maturation chaperone LptM [Halopseudomonas salegens]|uniref:Lipoprotein-attachment site-containing protein n=1 Tax=Halopseudomonas salegens TaxID=1434072 RepID=A0A1H2HX93_9GAMM|nr:lipoprotein [Halopseudomonas salegens]SDU36510.1 lipoprotein-attachment site-containing protein [Halopseudomonas salegens]
MKTFSAACFLILMLAGCGQKGPLYQPEGTVQPSSGAEEEVIQQPSQK